MAHARGQRGSRLDTAIFAVCMLVLGLAVLYPAVRLLVRAVATWDHAALFSGAGFAAARNTLLISMGTVFCSGIFGTALAVALARYRFPGSGLLGALAFLPLTLPPLVGTLGFYYLIGRDGFIPRVLEHTFGIAHAALPGPWAILIIHTYSFFVFFYAMVAHALAALDHAQVEAARTLGAGPWRTFFRVTLPQLRPALTGAGLLTFMSSNASFTAPYFFGQDFPMLSVAIYDARMNNNEAAALTLTVALAAISLLSLPAARAQRGTENRAGKGTATPLRTRGGRLAAGGLVWALALLLLAPHLVIAGLSLVDHRAWGAEVVPRHFTFANYATLFNDARAFTPILNSLWTAGLATLCAAAIGLPAAYLIARHRRGGRLIEAITMLPWALPGTVIAVALIVAFNDRWLPLYNTVWMLPLAYFVRELPLLTRVAGAAIAPFDATLIEAGRTLGASRIHVVRRVALPLLLPAIAAGAAMVFANGLGEFVASILLYVPANLPISIRINMDWRGDPGVAFAYSVLLMLIVGTTFYLARRLTGRVL